MEGQLYKTMSDMPSLQIIHLYLHHAGFFLVYLPGAWDLSTVQIQYVIIGKCSHKLLRL